MGSPWLTDEVLDFEATFREIERLEYVSRYGDYLAREFDSIRSAFKTIGENVSNDLPLATNWTTRTRQEEASIRQQYSKASSSHLVKKEPFHAKINRISWAMGLDVSSIKHTIP